jgi:hypothetical protein
MSPPDGQDLMDKIYKNLARVVAILPFSIAILANVDAESGEIPLCGVPPIVHFNANSFSNPTRISNKWLPLVPGTRLILEGQTTLGGPLAHLVVSTVTDLTKVINNVRTIVLLDEDISEGQLVERELAFFAQDNAGNVWNLGEYPEEFEKRKFIGAPNTWIAGLAGAEAGIHMLAKPRLGATTRYLQGWAPDIDFLDCAKVIKKGLKICVPFTCYKDVLVTDEVSPLDPGGGSQRKFHAPGVGIVHVGAVGDPEGETLALVNIVQLSTEELAEVRAKACALDQRAYRVSEVYRDTPPAKYRERPCSDG